MRGSRAVSLPMPHALVIGVGNSLAGDDAAGAEAAARLDGRPGVEVKIVHQLTPELAPLVAEASRVVFVDAEIDGEAVCVTALSAADEPEAAAWPTTHALTPRTILVLAGALYGRMPPAFLVTIPGRRFELGKGLSPFARRSIPRAVDAVEQLLRGVHETAPNGPPSTAHST